MPISLSSSRRRLSPAESRLAALEAARELLLDAGPQAVTLKAVAARIGRTHANLLHHFGSASGLQRALATFHARAICETIAVTVLKTRAGEATARDIVDLTFDAFDREGGGALAAWMLSSGNEDALDPIVESIHDLVDQLNLSSQIGDELQETTLTLVLMALGDALMGGPLATALGLPRERAREMAAIRLSDRVEEWRASSDEPTG
ncbi:TetR/AcrR family transcriptional regulator [Novosphingopyxis baekryungensis]|uniref:TetR/AcrR family transcriptional regulator n=1 Tax=Novosphingopyxis baekryungensis TaxID=279369 RepID=UPI0003B6762D|nr:helix-turn-helix domain-containing protein [Novosphingopyxis baekryungensis]